MQRRGENVRVKRERAGVFEHGSTEGGRLASATKVIATICPEQDC